MALNAPSSSSATCSLCSELYVDPRMLQCLHSFCSKCLTKSSEEQGSGTSIKCPTCENIATLPEGGVGAIQKDIRRNHEANIARVASRMQSEKKKGCDLCVDTSTGPAVSFCCDCGDFLCKMCSNYHKTCRKFLDHKLEPIGSSKSKSHTADIVHKPVHCQLHEGEILKFYCETCSALICCDCMTTKHAGHTHQRIEKVVEKEKADLVSIIASTDIKSIKVKLDDNISKGSNIMQQVQGNSEKPIEELIECAFTALMDTLSKRKETLLGMLGSIKTDLEVQGEEFKTLRKEIVETYEMITIATQAYTPAEMLSAKGAMTKRLEQLLKQYKETYLEPCRSDMISNKLDTPELVENIISFGLIVKGSYPEHAETDFYLRRVVAGIERKITITAHDVNGKRFHHGGENVEVKLSLTNDRMNGIEGKVVDNNDGTYTASFTPPIPPIQHRYGEHKLSITFEGQHIKGSPFDVRVRNGVAYETLSSSDKTCYHLSQSYPYDVVVDENGDMYAANYLRCFIEVFNEHGKQIRIIGATEQVLSSKGNGQFNCPSAIAIHGNVLYVAEDNNHCVQKLTTSGKFISKFGTHGSGDGQLNTPRGLCVHNDGRVFVSDCYSISVFDANDTFLYHITGSVTDDSKLSQPWGLAFDPCGNLHVADSSTNSIKMFTSQGKYISQYGCGAVNHPAGIAVDEEGNTFIVENVLSYDHHQHSYNRNGCYDSQLRVLNSQQHVLCTLTIAKDATGLGVTVDTNGSVYICCNSNYYVQKFTALPT